MKYFGILLGLFMIGCGAGKNALAPKHQVASVELITNTLYTLSSDELMGRNSGEPGNRQAGDFLSAQLKKYGIQPFFSSYNDTLSNFEPTTYNIVGSIPGSDATLKDEIVILGAHYDHIGVVKPIDGDSIANGANDNAAGVSIALELARNLQKLKPKRTVLVVFFTAEEKGLLGAKHLAKKLYEQKVNVVSMLNFEMLGLPMQREYLTYLTGYDQSNMAELLNEFAAEPIVGRLEKAEEFNLFKRSDNYPFYEVFNIPSQSFSSFDFENYPYYHHVKDEAELMDVEFMSSLTTKLIPVVYKLVNLPSGELRLK